MYIRGARAKFLHQRRSYRVDYYMQVRGLCACYVSIDGVEMRYDMLIDQSAEFSQKICANRVAHNKIIFNIFTLFTTIFISTFCYITRNILHNICILLIYIIFNDDLCMNILIRSLIIYVQLYGFWAEKGVQKINKNFFGHIYHTVFFRFFRCPRT